MDDWPSENEIPHLDVDAYLKLLGGLCIRCDCPPLKPLFEREAETWKLRAEGNELEELLKTGKDQLDDYWDVFWKHKDAMRRFKESEFQYFVSVCTLILEEHLLLFTHTWDFDEGWTAGPIDWDGTVSQFASGEAIVTINCATCIAPILVSDLKPISVTP